MSRIYAREASWPPGLSVEVARVEEAIGALADPASVAEAMEGARAEAARRVAEAEERAAHDRQARSAAEAAEHDATEAANAAWERLEAPELQLASETGEMAGSGPHSRPRTNSTPAR